MNTLIVGFDLDMTLVNTRAAVRHSLQALACETGADIDVEAIVANSGPPLHHHIGHLFPDPIELEEAVVLFRRYMNDNMHHVTSLPGAQQTIEYIRMKGGETLVVTAKQEALVPATLTSAGLHIDHIRGGLWAEQKATALKEMGAQLYVGDHTKDVLAAQIAGIPVIAVSTGARTTDELQAAGADIVLTSLEDFPAAFDKLLG